MKAMQVISLTLLSIMTASAQIFVPDKCPKPPVKENFDPARYLGKWYEIQKLPNSFQKGECGNAIYSLKSPGVIGVLNRGLLADGTVSSITGSAKPKDPSEPAKLEVSFFEDSPPGPYWVLSTDYEGHSLVYSCRNFGTFHVERAWILSRQPTLAEGTIEELHSLMASYGLSEAKMTTTQQDEAFCRAMDQ
ncbi:apolipoprotein Da, duplicate 2 [Lampris incognitus]|uniref:apolipoprotein Da, duplicate 2 n=1 Tax=Lampris incognitus TaxID=2546036 RepID=UPI0024B5DA62|nr:apolipoprotein Da, duplicate 2 [Lampris incognitus]